MARLGDCIGNYRLVEALASGTFGQVFRAEHKLLARRQVAIKFLHLERTNNQEESERFLLEAHLLNKLKHPAILPIIDVGLDNDVPYLITEYASKGTLRAYLKRRSGQPLTVEEALRIIVPIGEALQFAHERKIVHRDLKPENILFDAENKPLLADFGIAVILTTNSSYLGNVGGTAPYMAPEQFKGKARQQSDQYALGCLLYEMLTGQQPFKAPDFFSLGFLHIHEPPTPPRQITPGLPEHIEVAILKAMAKKSTDRYEDIAAFSRALRQPQVSQQEVRPETAAPQPAQNQQPSSRATQPGVPGKLPAQENEPAIHADASPSFPVAPSQEDETGAGPVPHNTQGSSQQITWRGTQPRLPLEAPSRENRPAPGVIAFPAPQDTPRITSKVNAPNTQGAQMTPRQPPAAQSLPGNGKLPGAQAPQSTPAPQNPPAGEKSKMVVKGPARTPNNTSARQSPVNGVHPNAHPTGPQSPYTRNRTRRLLLWFALLLLPGTLLIAALKIGAGLGPILPGTLSANITITPQSTLEQDNFLFTALPTGTPDPNRRQIKARFLKQTSDKKSATANATGSQSATRATGMLTFINTNNFAVTLAPTPITGNDGVAVSIYQNVVVPAASPFSVTVPAFTINAGAGGNIKAFDISRSCCTSGITVKNTAAFNGGRNAITNSIIQQSDIDGAVNPLATSLTQSMQSALQQQVQSTERVVDGSFNCARTIDKNHNAGDIAPLVTVTVSVTCTEEAFDFAAARQMATTFLQTHAQGDATLTGYQLVGRVVTGLMSDTAVTGQGQVNVEINAAERWVYQFTDAQLQHIKQALVKHTRADAQNILTRNPGIAAATISISNGDTLPANAGDITLTVLPVQGVQSTPTGPVNTATAGNAPGFTPTAVLGGS